MKKFHLDLQQYCTNHTSAQSDILLELERETFLKTLSPNMISGHYQGRMLAMLSKLLRPKNILEIGSYTGYSALCLAEGLADGGKLYTIEVNEELEYIIQKFVTKAGLQDNIEIMIGDAVDLVPTINSKFDLAFIDAGKHDYINHYELVLQRMNAGGIILADNVLWFGKVVDKKRDQDTSMLSVFNEHVKNDDRVEQIMLPIRDGLLVIRVL